MDRESKDAVAPNGKAGAGAVSRSGRRRLVALAAFGWLVAGLALSWSWQTTSEARFAAATAIGLSEREVRDRAGPPDLVLAAGQTANAGELAAYECPDRRPEPAALVYFRFHHAVLVSIGPDGFVQAVYWARAR